MFTRNNMVASHHELTCSFRVRNTTQSAGFGCLTCVFITDLPKGGRATKEASYLGGFDLANARFFSDGSYLVDVRQRVEELLWRGLEHGRLRGHGEREIIRLHGGRRVPHIHFDISFITFSHCREKLRTVHFVTLNLTRHKHYLVSGDEKGTSTKK